MEQLRQDLRFALRSLGRRPAFMLVAVLTLALGLGATTSIFSVVYGVLLRPLPFPHAERLLSIAPVKVGEPARRSASHLNFVDWKAQSRTVEAMAAYDTGHNILSGMGEAELVPSAVTTPGLFRTLGVPLALGRDFTAEEDRVHGPDVAIVSYGFWKDRLGGDPDVLGRTLMLEAKPVRIVGVAGKGFDFPDGARIWRPLQNDDDGCGRGCNFLQVVGRLAPGATVAQAHAELAGIGERLAVQYPLADKGRGVDAASLLDVTVGSVRPALLVLLGAVALVLLIACANVANLLLARGAAREAELAVRAALGAGRRRLLRQLLTESVLLALLGGAAGVVLAAWGVRLLRPLAPGDFPRIEDVGVSAPSLLFALGLVLATTLLFGLVPALHFSRTSLAGSLRQGGRSGGDAARRERGRAALVAAEVGLSVVLLAGAGLLIRSFVALRAVNPGFDPAGVATFRPELPEAAYPKPEQAVLFYQRLEQRIEAIPGVAEVGTIIGLPLGTTHIGTSFQFVERPVPDEDQPGATLFVADPGYFPTMGIRLVAGRLFTDADREGAPGVALISQRAAAQFFPGEDPVGKRIELGVSLGFDEPQRTIVGVVGDVRDQHLETEPMPALYVPEAQSGGSFAGVVVRARPGVAAASLLPALGRTVHELDPNVPIGSPTTMERVTADATARSRFYLVLLSLFAALAAALSAVGIYGVVAYLVSLRTREIGVRVALGANALDVVGLVVRQGAVPAALGIVGGVLAALGGGSLMASLLFRVPPRDPVTLAAVALLVAGVVLLASVVPARRALRIPPATALRGE